MSSIFERAAATGVFFAGISFGAVMLHREFATAPAPGIVGEAGPPVQVADWKSTFASGHWIGDSTAPVVVVEFGDYECPFCRRFGELFTNAKQEFGDAVALLFVDYPLPTHKFAKPAIVAAQCAEAQGNFAEMHHAIFARQDSIGLKSWWSYASSAGVKDSIAYLKCIALNAMPKSLADGIAYADALGIRATPTVIINGLQYPASTFDSLPEMIRSAMEATAAPQGVANSRQFRRLIRT